MPSFKNTVITDKGRSLMAKIVAGTATPQFTKIRTSDYQYPEATNFESLTSMNSVKQEVDVASVTKLNVSTVNVSGAITNIGLASGYYVRNIGLYALDPIEGEILYSITPAIIADWMPPTGGSAISSIMVDLETTVSNSDNVSLEVNPNATATVKMINDVKTELADVKGFVGYTEDDIYGVEVDFVNRKFTKLAGSINKSAGDDYDNVQAFGGRRRCILTNDGVVLAYHGDVGYTETGALTQQIVIEIKPAEGENPAVTETYPIGTEVQVMVEQPKFYYKVIPLKLEKVQDGKGFHMRKARYYVSDTKKAGFKLHPAFIHDGKEKNFIYLSAFEGSVFDKSAGAYLLADEQITDFTANTGDILSSIAYAKPASGLTQGLTRNSSRIIAQNRGKGWFQSYAATVAASQLLFLIEYASFNTQTAIGMGNVSKTDDGSTSMTEITGATTNLGNKSGSVTNVNGINIVSYRGEENFWGNLWKWVDGLNIEAKGLHNLYVADHGFADDIGSDPYKDAGITLAKANGYISAFAYNEEFDWLFFASETVGNSSLPVGDYFYQNNTYNGWLAAFLGGSWDDGSAAGGFCWSVYNVSSSRYRYRGGRLVYVPNVA